MELHPSKPWLVLTILLTTFATCAVSITLFDCTIDLYNTSNKTLTARCNSNGAYLGSFTIPSFGYQDFVSHVLVRERSYATCSMTLGNLHGTFEVFDWGRDKNRCQQKLCYWMIDEKGLSLLIGSDFVLQYKWP